MLHSKCSITSNSTGGWIRHLTYWALANIQVSNSNTVLRWENLFIFVMYIYSHKIHKIKWVTYELFMWAKLPFLFNVFNFQLKIVLHLFNVCVHVSVCVCVCVCVCACMCTGTHATAHRGGQETIYGSRFFLSIMWVPGIKLVSLAAGAFTD